MVKSNYLLYLEQTLTTYSTKTKQHLLKDFINKGLAAKNSVVTGQLQLDGIEVVDVADKNLDEALSACLYSNDAVIKEIEKWEFIKDYKYSVLFTCDKFDDVVSKVDKMSELDECEKDYLFNNIKDPVYYCDDERSFLKFNVRYAAIHPSTRAELLLKYPILVVFHKKSKLVEVRFDVLKKVFVLDQEQDSYVNIISSVKAYVERNYECILIGLDLTYMVGVAKQNDDIKLIAQYMKFPTGGCAQLDVGNNQEYMLPLIGELRNILFDYQQELEKVPVLNDVLEQFMYEKEEMSDYPWIEALWENEIKTRSIHVKFVFNYMNKEYGLIQHYYSNVLVGMERMNYVVDYIASNRGDNTGETE